MSPGFKKNSSAFKNATSSIDFVLSQIFGTVILYTKYSYFFNTWQAHLYNYLEQWFPNWCIMMNYQGNQKQYTPPSGEWPGSNGITVIALLLQPGGFLLYLGVSISPLEGASCPQRLMIANQKWVTIAIFKHSET